MTEEPTHSYHDHSSPYYYDAEGIKRHLVEGEELAGWMTTGTTIPLTEQQVEDANDVRRMAGEVSYEVPLPDYTVIGGHSHETPDNNGGVEHTHE